jgi:hypothetical protein
MCDATDADFLALTEIIQRTEDHQLAAALQLVVRGRSLPPGVITMLLNLGACAMDAVEKMQRVMTAGK